MITSELVSESEHAGGTSVDVTSGGHLEEEEFNHATIGRRRAPSFATLIRIEDTTTRAAATAPMFSHKGRLGAMLVLELLRDAKAVAAEYKLYREYSRAELIDKLHMLLAKRGVFQVGLAGPRRPSMLKLESGRLGDGRRFTHGHVSYRDLHAIDPAMDASSKPALIIRRGCILVTVPPLHAIITSEEVLLFPEPGADSDLEPIIKHLQDYSPGLLAPVYGSAPPPPQKDAANLASPSTPEILLGMTAGVASSNRGTFEYEALSVIMNTADSINDKELERCVRAQRLCPPRCSF